MKLSQIAQLLGAQLIGDDAEVSGVADLKDAGPGEVSFFTNPKYQALALQTKATAVILGGKTPGLPCAQLVCKNPYLAFAQLLTHLSPPERPAVGIHPTAVVENDVELGKDVSIGANVYVGRGCRLADRVVLRPNVVLEAEVSIGADSWLHPNVTVRERVRLGQRVIIQSGAVLGSDGFGYAPQADGHYYKIPQIGTVELEDDVEIGANVTIDRATLGRTLIGRGSKIDNLVMVAHNVEIGADTILIAQVGISGSTKVGRHCTLAGQVGVAGHLNIGDNVVIAAQSGVTKDIAANQRVGGFPAIPIMEDRRKLASLANLPQTIKKINSLTERVTKLENRSADEEDVK